MPFVLKMDSSDFPKYIQKLEGFKQGVGIPASFVPHSTFWLTNEAEKILGVVNIRHHLTGRLLIEGGHIGYGIRPSERRKGYATMILKLALIEAKKLGIERALVTCHKKNTASAKTILKHGGKFYRENLFNDEIVVGYWIENK